MGGEILARVNPTFDYLREYVYLERGKNYKKAFKHDMSGLFVSAFGPDLELLLVDHVDEKSPAANAGIMKNDIILKVNSQSIQTLGLTRILTMLRARQGKRIKLKIVRDGEVLKKRFKLEKFI